MSNAPKVTLNITQIEREEEYDPFVVVFERPKNWQELRAKGQKPPKDWNADPANVESRAVEMTDPALIDWKDLLDLEQPIHFLRHCVTDEDREFIKTCPVPAWQFGKMIEAYQRHYGLDDRGNGSASRI